MCRQRLVAAQALAILQDLPSDCSGDEDSDSETKEMVNSTVAGVGGLSYHHRIQATMSQIHQHNPTSYLQ